MGLSTSHNCWHSSYGSFHAWRCALALAAYPELCAGSDDAARAYTARFAPQGVAECERICMGEWATPPADVLAVLLLHSDCDGQIPHYYTKRLADRLQGLLPALANPPGWPDGWHVQLTEQFIAGLLDAHAKGDAVEFY